MPAIGPIAFGLIVFKSLIIAIIIQTFKAIEAIGDQDEVLSGLTKASIARCGHYRNSTRATKINNRSRHGSK